MRNLAVHAKHIWPANEINPIWIILVQNSIALFKWRPQWKQEPALAGINIGAHANFPATHKALQMSGTLIQPGADLSPCTQSLHCTSTIPFSTRWSIM